MTFGKRVQSLRQHKAINQRDLAARVDIDVTYLSKIENDRLPPPSHDTIVRLAEELDEDPDALLLLADKMPKDLKEIIVKSPARPDFFRSVSDLSDDELKKVQSYAEQLKRDRTKP